MRQAKAWRQTDIGRSVVRAASLLGGTAAAVALAGCASPGPAFVRAERATYDAIAPEYLAYVRADAALTGEQKARRERTVQTWDLSLREHEQGQGW